MFCFVYTTVVDFVSVVRISNNCECTACRNVTVHTIANCAMSDPLSLRISSDLGSLNGVGLSQVSTKLLQEFNRGVM